MLRSFGYIVVKTLESCVHMTPFAINNLPFCQQRFGRGSYIWYIHPLPPKARLLVILPFYCLRVWGVVPHLRRSPTLCVASMERGGAIGLAAKWACAAETRRLCPPGTSFGTADTKCRELWLLRAGGRGVTPYLPPSQAAHRIPLVSLTPIKPCPTHFLHAMFFSHQRQFYQQQVQHPNLTSLSSPSFV